MERDGLIRSLEQGHYYRKQIASKVGLIAWSHTRRFRVALRLAEAFAGKRILDYGSGDGTFLGMLMAQSKRPSEAVGAELDATVVRDCRQRFADAPGLTFVSIDDVKSLGPFDAVFCMEVLEHVVDVPAILESLHGLLSAGGKLVVSVPVETGIPLMIKQAARRAAARRGNRDYPGSHPYTWRQFAASIFAGAKQHVTRPVHEVGGGFKFHDHKGFNWRSLRLQVERRFRLERVFGSPVAGLSPHLSSQVWFVLTKRT